MILVKRKSDGSRFVLKRMFIEDQAPEDQAEVMNEIKVCLASSGLSIVQLSLLCLI